MLNPRLTDNDEGEITVTLDGKELRGWSYENDDQRRRKMVQAHEYVEGWHDGAAFAQTAALTSQQGAGDD